MWTSALNGLDPSSGKESSDWKAFQFMSADNPHLTTNEIESLYDSTSEDAQQQELEASFESTGGKVFTYEQFPIVPCPFAGEYVLACDLAGFSAAEGKNKPKAVLDDHALALVKVHEKGFHVERVWHGKWDVRETALRIVKAYRDHNVIKMGIEVGMAKNAVQTFIEEYQDAYGTYFEIHPLKHNNNRKEGRIKWALQGRADQGKITLEDDRELPAEERWIGKFLGQAVDFPNPLAHDDLLDAVAYGVDQLAEPGMGWSLSMVDNWEPMDDLAGY